MIQAIKKFHIYLPHERSRAGLLLIMILIMAFEMIGVASILPFISVLTNPSLIDSNIILNKMFNVSNMFGVENNQEFLFALGVLVFVLLVISLTFKCILIIFKFDMLKCFNIILVNV